MNGTDLDTTIDLDLQWYAQRVLRQTVEDSRADSGFAVVVHTETGEIMALADHPTFDAGQPLLAPEGDLGSRAMSDVYEPGSVEKALTLSALIDAGKVTPRTQIRVPSSLSRDGRTIGDWFDHGRLRLTLAGVLAKSSNIGTVLAADQFDRGQLRRYLTAFGLGRPHRHRGAWGAPGHPPRPEPVDRPGPGPGGVRPVGLGQRRADGRRHQHDRQRRGAGLAEPDPGRGRGPTRATSSAPTPRPPGG